MKCLIIACGLVGLALFTGCGDKQGSSPPPPPASPKPATGMPSLKAASETPPPPGTPPGAAPATAAVTKEVPTYEGKDEAEKLTKALHDYYDRSGAEAPLITSLEGLVKAGYLKSVPVPPPGKKYVVDKFQVRLEKK